MRALLLGLLSACGAALPPADRAVCYAMADRATQARVDSECVGPDGHVHFATCPVRDAIMADQRAQQESCK